MKDLIKVIVRRGVVFGGLLILLVMFAGSIDAKANSICCGVYTKKSSTTSEKTGWSVYGDADSTYLCGQILYMEIMTSDGARSIDYATLYIDGEPVYTLKDIDDSWSWDYYAHVFSTAGVHTCRWIGKWANSDQTFNIWNTLYLNTITKGTYNTYNYAGDTVQYSVSITGANTNKQYNYQWYYATSAGGTKTKILGATSRTYSFSAASNLNDRYYYCYVSNGYVNGFSSAFHLYTKYKVNYDVNDGTGASNYQIKYHDYDITIRNEVPTRTGYTFLGWSTSSTATVANSSYAPGKTYSTNSNLTLYAVWKLNEYTVSYNANKGSDAPSSQTKYHGKTLILRMTEPTRTGYSFLGWSTSSTATRATYQPGGRYTANNGVTLYAVWKLIPTQNSNVNNNNENSNSGTQTQTTTAEKKNVTTQKTSPSTPVKKSAVFKTGQILKIGSLKYKIMSFSGSGGTVAVVGAINKNKKQLTIPKSIQKKGISFKITEIARNAFKNYKKLSFLRIKATTIKKIGKNALKGTKRKIQIMVPASKLKKYAKMLKKAR